MTWICYSAYFKGKAERRNRLAGRLLADYFSIWSVITNRTYEAITSEQPLGCVVTGSFGGGGIESG